jgi:hypothetical protein
MSAPKLIVCVGIPGTAHKFPINQRCCQFSSQWDTYAVLLDRLGIGSGHQDKGQTLSGL